MEHLKQGDFDPKFAVRFRGSQIDDEHFNFHSFPSQSKWEISKGQLLKKGSEWNREEASTFLQSWLFFGLLRAIFIDDQKFQSDEFVREDRKYLSTEKLQEFLERWQHRIRKSPHKCGELIRAQLVLKEAHSLVTQHCSAKGTENLAPEWLVDEEVELSIIVLGQALTDALAQIQQNEGIKLPGGWRDDFLHNQGWGYSRLVLRELGYRSWCKKNIEMLKLLLRGNVIGLLLTNNYSPLYRYHLLCSEKKCIARYADERLDNCDFLSLKNLEESKGSPPKLDPCHYKVSCACEMIASDPRRLTAIIDNGNVPLLQYDVSRKQLKIVEMEGWNKEFSVLSHVWEDGLGNDRNAVYRCVLELLAKTFAGNDPGEHVSSPLNPNHLFWLDVLAIPIGDKYTTQRRQVIGKIHEIYKRARSTYVLELGMLKSKADSSFSAAIRITTSLWMTKIWTLQEAFLSSDLQFVFSDKLLPLRDFQSRLRLDDFTLHKSLLKVARAFEELILQPQRPRIEANEQYVDADFVASVWRAVRLRDATVNADEPLALAILFNLDTTAFVDESLAAQQENIPEAELENRMCTLLQMLANLQPCAIPPGIIFLPGEKLSRGGFRWAPRTWLSNQEIFSPDPMRFTTRPAHLPLYNSMGLEVEFPGIELHQQSSQAIQWEEAEEVSFPTGITLDEWYVFWLFNKKEVFPSSKDFRDKRLAIIALRLPILQPKEIALLVVINHDHSGRFFVHVFNTIWLGRERCQDRIGCGMENVRDRKFNDVLCGERLPDNQKWCIDGRPPTPSHRPVRRRLTGPNSSGNPPMVPVTPRRAETSIDDQAPKIMGRIGASGQ